MKLRIRLLIFTITLMSLVAGFCLPGIISSVEDVKLESEVSQYENQNPQFILPVDQQITDSLKIIGNGYTWIDLTSGDNLDSKEAYQSALDALKFFEDYGFDGINSEIYAQYTISPFLAVTDESKAVFWNCAFLNKSDSRLLHIIIDDKSGMMVNLSVRQVAQTVEIYSTMEEEYIRNWAGACAKYYGFEKYEIVDEKIYTTDSVISTKRYNIIFEDATGESMNLYCIADHPSFIFNPNY